MGTLLSSLSHKIGRAINLPEVFFKPVPLTEILDTKLSPLSVGGSVGLSLGRPSTRTQRAQSRRSARAAQANAAAAQHFVLEGEVVHGKTTRFAINGTDFALNSGTWVIGELRLGVAARVKGRQMEKGFLDASSVVVVELR